MKGRDILGSNIRYFRKKTKITQEELASLSNLHRTYIDSIENKHRNVSIDNIEAIAGALNLEIYELLKERKNINYD